ncbi:MAG: hypothetical protein L6N96_06850 [Candidatus Methylarchaceae archaeon HK02M2]|nr:hypothetical protein [Candidatus Methylarchaceae archaeon HK02M2]
MAVVRLRTLECINTKGEKKEEVYLCISVDGSSPGVFGPYEMKQGDTLNLTSTFEGRDILITLSEEEWGRDDHYGGVRILHPEEVEDADLVGLGRYVAHLPPNDTWRYNLYFDVGADEDDIRGRGRPGYCLALVSLHCTDAQ